MGIVIRQGLKASIASYLGVAIGAFSILWIQPKMLSPSEIGLLRLLQDVAFLFAGFSQLGLMNITDKFFPNFRDLPKKNYGFFIFIWIYPFIGILIFAIVFFGFKDFWISLYAQKVPQATAYFHYIFPLAILIMYVFVLEAYIRGHFRIVVPTFIREVFFKIGVLILVLGYFFKYWDFEFVIINLLSIYALMLILQLIYTKQLKIFFLTFPKKEKFTKTQIKEMLTYGFFIILGGLSATLIMRIDVLMIGAWLGTAALGVYTISFFIGTIIEIPRRALANIVVPILAQAWKENNLKKIAELYEQTARNQFIIGGLLFLGIWCNVHNVFAFIPNAQIYIEGKYVIFFIALARLIDMALGVNGEIILQSSYYRFNLYLAMGLALLLALTNMIFIPLMGITGAALATTISILLWNITRFLFLYQKFKIQPFSLKFLKIIIVLFLGYAIGQIPTLSFTFLDLFVRSTLITLVVLGGVWFLNLSPEGKDFVKKLLH